MLYLYLVGDRKIGILNLKPVNFWSCCVNYHDVWQNIDQ